MIASDLLQNLLVLVGRQGICEEPKADAALCGVTLFCTAQGVACDLFAFRISDPAEGADAGLAYLGAEGIRRGIQQTDHIHWDSKVTMRNKPMHTNRRHSFTLGPATAMGCWFCCRCSLSAAVGDRRR